MKIDKRCPHCGGDIERFEFGEKCVNTPMNNIALAYFHSAMFKRAVPADKAGAGRCSYVKFDKKESWKDAGDSRIGALLADLRPRARKNIEKAVEEQEDGRKRPLGELLVNKGVFTTKCIDRALQVQEILRKNK